MTPSHLDKILSEWAIHSPDGLAFGHTSVENVRALKDVLCENGVSDNDIQQIVIDVINGGTLSQTGNVFI
jgi:hypothetical protein